MMQQQQQEMMQQQMAMQAQQAQQQPVSTFNPEEEQMKSQLKTQEQVAIIRAKLEADIALETAKAGIASNAQEEQQDAQMQADYMSGIEQENRSTM